MGSKLFASDFNRVTTIFEIAVGFGFSIGPAIGSLLYNIGGFRFPFLLLAFMFLGLAPVVTWVVPDSVDELYLEVNESMHSGKDNLTSGGSYRELLASRRIIFLLIGTALGTFAFSFPEPILAPFLGDAYGVDVELSGVLFVLFGAGYLFASLILPWFYAYFSRRTLIHASGLCMAMALILCGPSRLINLPSSLTITALGYLLLGFFCVKLVILIPELLSASKQIASEGSQEVHDLASGL